MALGEGGPDYGAHPSQNSRTRTPGKDGAKTELLPEWFKNSVNAGIARPTAMLLQLLVFEDSHVQAYGSMRFHHLLAQTAQHLI